MPQLTFAALADHLRHGREIEFAYNARRYSITNHSGMWHLGDDTGEVLLATLCRFEEKDLLVDKIRGYVLGGKTIAAIFDEQFLMLHSWILFEPGV